MTDKDEYIKKLTETHPLRESILRSAIRTLKLPSGSRGLDAGCGIGLPALLLAKAVGPDGHVIGLDISPELLLHAEKIAKESGLSGQISFKKGDVNKLPFEDDSFDWVWSSDCVGYPSADKPLSLLKELARVVKPGGIVVLASSGLSAAGSKAERHLFGGHPLCEGERTRIDLLPGTGLVPGDRPFRA